MRDDDCRLVEAAIAGDAEAFGLLYDRYANDVFTYLYYRLGDLPTAEDLTSEVFLKAWRSIKHYRYQGIPFIAWLYRIAHNLLVDHHRREGRRPVQVSATVDEVPDGGRSGLTEALNRADLLRAIARLSEDQQQVIVMRFILGMSSPEIAEVLGRSKGAIDALQHRALKNLRRLLS